MFKVILRSVCVGIATLVAAAFLGIFVGLPITDFLTKNVSHDGDSEVGWDLVTMAHNLPPIAILLPLLVFAVGFFFGFRYFSKSLARK
jgi:ABC-type Fe3+ transport system permease subunit